MLVELSYGGIRNEDDSRDSAMSNAATDGCESWKIVAELR